jgi:hypothetical protein
MASTFVGTLSAPFAAGRALLQAEEEGEMVERPFSDPDAPSSSLMLMRPFPYCAAAEDTRPKLSSVSWFQDVWRLKASAIP